MMVLILRRRDGEEEEGAKRTAKCDNSVSGSSSFLPEMSEGGGSRKMSRAVI